MNELTLREHCRRIGKLNKDRPKSEAHKAKLRVILKAARERKTALAASAKAAEARARRKAEREAGE